MRREQALIMIIILIFAAISVFYVSVLLGMRKKIKRLTEQADELELKNRRLRIVMNYIPYDIMQLNLMNGHLGTIDRETGAVKEFSEEEKQKEQGLLNWKTVYPALGKVLGSLKEKFMSGEDSVQEILTGYAGSVTKYGRLTAKAVYNNFGSPTEAICIIEDVTDAVIGRQKAEKKLEQVIKDSQKDPLTGLYNKESFFTVGQQMIDEHTGMSAALIFMDLDNFKSLNDLIGHMTGDKALMDVADKLRDLFAKRDIMARFGGDEFCILSFDNTVSGLRDRLDLMIERMRETYSDDKSSVMVSASVGMTLMPRFGTDLKKVMTLSDKALYCAKEKGKNRFVIYEEGMEPEGYVGRED